MTPTDTQKKCIKCEEIIHPYATSCPYCGCELGEEPPQGMQFERDEEVPEAPYRMQESAVDAEPLESPFRFVGSEKEPVEESQPSVASVPPEEEDFFVVFKPMAMLLGGMVFLLFGLALLLFARDGVLTLHWNGNWWPFYLVFSIPMLFLGWRSLQQLDEVS